MLLMIGLASVMMSIQCPHEALLIQPMNTQLDSLKDLFHKGLRAVCPTILSKSR